MSTRALPDYAVLVDIEASATISLKDRGAFVIAEHPDTRLICAAVALVANGIVGPVVTIDALAQQSLPAEVVSAIVAGATVMSWGDYDRILLEWAGIGAAIGWPAVSASAWLSGIDIALASNMPAGLEACAVAVGLGVTKDPRGKKLIRKYCVPNKQGKVTDIALHHEDRDAMLRYCGQDIEVMGAVLAVLPPLSPNEAKIAEATWKMNCRGVHIDRALAEGLARWDQHQTASIGAEALDRHEINIKSQPQLLAALTTKGYVAPINRKTGRPTLGRAALSRCAPPDDPHLQDLLRLHSESGDSSLRKARAALMRTCRDGRARGLFVYAGTRTMRWSSRALQLQNLPRPVRKLSASDMAALARVFSSTLLSPEAIAETLKLVWPERPGTLAVSTLRGLLIPGEGSSFAVADLKSIELLTNFGAAGIEDGLANIAAGRDEYSLFINQDALPAIDRAIADPRQVDQRAQLEQSRSDIAAHARDYGKRALLSMQYGASAAGLAAQMNIPIAVATLLREAYLARYPRMVAHWAALLESAVLVTAKGGVRRLEHCDVRFRVSHDYAVPYLEMVRPSGEALRYPFPEVSERMRGPWRSSVLSTMAYDKGGTGLRRDVKMTEFPEHSASSIARDLLAEAFLAADAAGLNPVALVHDEIICETSELEALLAIMRIKPAWCPPEWPIDAEGARLPERYRKI